jgi:hypothetical protein
MFHRCLETYKYLTTHLNPKDLSWINSSVGADLWIDGFDAIQNSNKESVKLCLKQIFTAHSALTQLDIYSLIPLIDTWETLSEEYTPDDWLAAGITICEAVGGIPKLWPASKSIVNDTVAFLLSRSYRALRVHGYNLGVRFIFSDLPGEYLFRPDLRYFVIPKNFCAPDLSPQRAQFYFISHELVHFWNFADLYQSLFGPKDYTASMLLNAEEFCCAFDLHFLRELSEKNYAPNLIEEFCNIETGPTSKSKKNMLDACNKSTDEQIYLEKSLKMRAQNFLSEQTVFRCQSTNSNHSAELWISDSAIQQHATKTEEYVDYLAHPIRQYYGALLPKNHRHLQTAIAACDETWADTSYKIRLGSFDPIMRKYSLIKNQIRFSIYQIAEHEIEKGQTLPDETFFSWARSAALCYTLADDQIESKWNELFTVLKEEIKFTPTLWADFYPSPD